MKYDITLDVLAHLKRQAGGISRAELVKATGLNDRLVREAISDLRRQGHLIICDASGGYRFAQSFEDVFLCVKSIERQARVLNEVAAAMLTAAAKQFNLEFNARAAQKK